MMHGDSPTRGRETTSRRPNWVLVGVLALALGLRLIRLGTLPYWHDEVHNLVASEDLYGLLVHGKLVSNHPPLPYLLVAAWRALGMDRSEWTMRLLPVSAGGAVPVELFAVLASLRFISCRLSSYRGFSPVPNGPWREFERWRLN
jgi:predicted membrane-bound mannosyltransferase